MTLLVASFHGIPVLGKSSPKAVSEDRARQHGKGMELGMGMVAAM